MKPAPFNSTHIYPLGTVNGTPSTVKRDHSVLSRIWRRVANMEDKKRIAASKMANEGRSLKLKGV